MTELEKKLMAMTPEVKARHEKGWKKLEEMIKNDEKHQERIKNDKK